MNNIYDRNQKNSSLTSELNETKKSVSDGKSSIASAITAKGVTTESDATFAIMAENITKLATGATIEVLKVANNNASNQSITTAKAYKAVIGFNQCGVEGFSVGVSGFDTKASLTAKNSGTGKTAGGAYGYSLNVPAGKTFTLQSSMWSAGVIIGVV